MSTKQAAKPAQEGRTKTSAIITEAERMLHGSKRHVSGGITVSHSFATPEYVDILGRLMDARYQAQADERE